MENRIFLSIVIPCFNEKENLERGVLEEICGFLTEQDFTWEVIVSDDGSTDESRGIVKEKIKKIKNLRLLENPHGGKPFALLSGIKKAVGKYILFSDMDQSTPISQILKLTPYISDYDVIIGSRGISRKDFPVYRKLGAIIFSSFRRMLILPEIIDTQCGFKMFKKDVIGRVFPRLEFFKQKQRTHGWRVTSYDVELLHILKKMGYKIKEVEVEWKDRDISTNKGSGLNKYFRESKEMLVQILRVKLNDLRGYYNFK